MAKLKLSPLDKALSWYVAILLGVIVIGIATIILHNLFFEITPFTRDPNPGSFVCHGWKNVTDCGFFDYLGNLFRWTLPMSLILWGPLYLGPFLLVSFLIIFGLYKHFK